MRISDWSSDVCSSDLRRGENISASDIETTLGRLAGVAQVAAYAVPSDIPGGEDEIMLSIVREPGATLQPAESLVHARLHMPRFAQPRYLAFVEDQIGRAHVRTPVTHAHIVCRLLLVKT